MIKSSKTSIIVDSVEMAVKFYTEKLAFDISELVTNKDDKKIDYALLRKGKCFIIFKKPKVEELAEFSFIKRCASRCVGVVAEMKKGIEKYYIKCSKKNITIIDELKDYPNCGYKMFSLKDPFGIKLTFTQPIPGFTKKYEEFAGMKISTTDESGQPKTEAKLLNEMIKHLKTFGILRRAAKKYAKLWLKNKNK
ncbi:hypothetical protein GF322_00555 [Candidatus Dependentiae bacterium]|nr:hypothetical protein [Candidatus Dependentiae bacterium]